MQDLELLKVDEFIACEVDITYDNFKDKLKFTIKNLYNIEQLLQKSIKKITLNLSDQDDEHQIVAIANSLTKIDETITHDLCMVDIVIYYHHELAKFEIKFKEHKKFILNYNNISLLTNLKFSDFIFDI